ncbi:hypothetical protein [Streptomyces sp. CBMA156]|uniref:hypothetical protein n=1 Tax=Streptomyces sp. CBMA156 TaxID=1930280 RepID=UPI001661E83E|nr:hypothetical protein [Streptomyces sp. CBMA156]MBD0674855.1 hypothetical protein [Streptomyces sp. CBMA156]
MFRASAPLSRTVPAAADAVAGTVPRLLRAGWHRPADQGGPGAAPRPAVQEVHRQIADLYGTRVLSEGFTDSPLRPTPQLAAGALDALGPLAPDEAPQVAVLAYTTPDFEHTTLTASLLQHRLPGEPLCFAVSDQGVLSPFTALRIAVEYARRSDWSRLLLVVVDQSSQPYPGPASGQYAAEHDSAVALLLAWDGGTSPVAGMGQGPAGQVLPALRADLSGAALFAAGTGLAAGPGIPPSAAPRRDAEPGLPCTGVWAALREARGGRAVLADHDRGLDRLAHCTLELPAREGGVR